MSGISEQQQDDIIVSALLHQEDTADDVQHEEHIEPFQIKYQEQDNLAYEPLNDDVVRSPSLNANAFIHTSRCQEECMKRRKDQQITSSFALSQQKYDSISNFQQRKKCKKKKKKS